MNDIKDVIKDVPLHSIMLAGTHNSGAWSAYLGKKSSDNVLLNYIIWYKICLHAYNRVNCKFLKSSYFMYSQDDSIYQQLIHGIRYLDIRAAYYPETKEKFWVNHGEFRVRPMNEILQDVKQFVQETSE